MEKKKSKMAKEGKGTVKKKQNSVNLQQQSEKMSKPNSRKKPIKKYKVNKKVITIVSFLVLIIISYCIYKVVALIQNPTNTFSVEQGKIYQEEAAIGYIIREYCVYLQLNSYKRKQL